MRKTTLLLALLAVFALATAGANASSPAVPTHCSLAAAISAPAAVDQVTFAQAILAQPATVGKAPGGTPLSDPCGCGAAYQACLAGCPPIGSGGHFSCVAACNNADRDCVAFCGG